jgi:hypothetical protein
MYLQTRASNNSINTALTLDSSQNATFAGEIALADSKPIRFGDSGEFIIEHSSNTNTHMKHTGAGHIYMQSVNDIYFRNNTTQENYLVLNNNGSVDAFHNNVKKLETTAAGVTVTGTVSDSKGDLRSTNFVSSSSQYTLASSNAGDTIQCSSGGWLINNATGFSAGDMVTFINNSGSDQTIATSNVTLYNTADGSTGNRTLAARGMATAICSASNTYYISGAGLS